jgi:hypothetical protein
MFNKIPPFSKALSLLVLVVILLILIFSGLFVTIALIGASVVPLTWIWGLLTGQSYERVCDNSEIVYRLNQIGKWTLLIYIALLIIKVVIF